MAKAIGDDELQLKKRARRRLVGAIALVLLIVIFLPMFLAGEPKPLNQDIAINIPPLPTEESAKPAPAPPPQLPLGPATESTPAAPAASLTEEAFPKAGGTVEPAPKPEAKVVPKATTKPAPVGKSTAGDAYLVQLGAFSNAANAKSLQKKLQDNKFKAHTELVQVPGGDRTRVRVGPYPSREAAEKARERLKTLKLVMGDATVVRQGD